MASLITKEISPISITALAAVILAGIFAIQYFSPSGRCERKAKQAVYEAAAVADISEVSQGYRTIIEDMIAEEKEKCMDERGK